MRFIKTRKFLIEELKSRFASSTYYHNIDHSLEVESYVIEISKVEKLSDQELEILRIAALSHDIGHSVSHINHEKISCTFVEKSLPEFGYSSTEISLISRLIMATSYPHHPEDKLEEILCDADLSYLGTDLYFEHAGRLRKELYEVQNREKFSEKEWILFQLNFLKNHNYFRPYSKEKLNNNKNSIIEELTQQLNKI